MPQTLIELAIRVEAGSTLFGPDGSFCMTDPTAYLETMNRRAAWLLSEEAGEWADREAAALWLATNPILRGIVAEETAAYWCEEGHPDPTPDPFVLDL